MKFSECKDYLIRLGYKIENYSDMAYAMNMEASKANEIKGNNMKYVKMKNLWECWDKDPEWMMINKAGRVVKVGSSYSKEILEKDAQYNIRIFHYLAKDKTASKWLQLPESEEIPDDLFKVVPYDEQKCLDSGIIEFHTEEEYNKIFYPSGKVIS